MTTISVNSRKGGVGKTTTVVNLGAAFAEQGKRVLLVDLDSQAGLTVSLGFDPLQFEEHVYHVFLEKKTLQDITIPTEIKNLWLAPTNIDLSGAELDLNRGVLGWEWILTKAIQQINGQYDVVILDNPPTLECVTMNSLIAADISLICLQCTYLALRSLEWLFKIIKPIKEKVRPQLEVLFVRTMYDSRTLHAKEVSEEIVKREGQKVLKTIIKQTVRFADATVAGQPILTYDPDSDGANAYRQLAKEFETYLK